MTETPDIEALRHDQTVWNQPGQAMRERREAADTIEALRAENERLRVDWKLYYDEAFALQDKLEQAEKVIEAAREASRNCGFATDAGDEEALRLLGNEVRNALAQYDRVCDER